MKVLRTLSLLSCATATLANAQTALDLNVNLQVVEGTGVDEYEIQWNGLQDHAYLLLYSSDLENWSYPEPQVFVGQDAVITGSNFLVLDDDKHFWRIVMSSTPMASPLEFDPDNDRVGSQIEFNLGWDPMDGSSSDGDIVPDDLENYYWGGLSRDGTGNADNDALNDYGDILAGGDSESPDNFEDDADSDTILSVMSGLGAEGEDWPEVTGFTDSVNGNADLIIYLPGDGFQRVSDDGTFLELSGKVPHF